MSKRRQNLLQKFTSIDSVNSSEENSPDAVFLAPGIWERFVSCQHTLGLEHLIPTVSDNEPVCAFDIDSLCCVCSPGRGIPVNVFRNGKLIPVEIYEFMEKQVHQEWLDHMKFQLPTPISHSSNFLLQNRRITMSAGIVCHHCKEDYVSAKKQLEQRLKTMVLFLDMTKDEVMEKANADNNTQDWYLVDKSLLMKLRKEIVVSLCNFNSKHMEYIKRVENMFPCSIETAANQMKTKLGAYWEMFSSHGGYEYLDPPKISGMGMTANSQGMDSSVITEKYLNSRIKCEYIQLFPLS